MALQTSGAISLNEIHIEAGGSSGTAVSINDADIRALIGKGSGAAMSFSEWYGASAVTSAVEVQPAAKYQLISGPRGYSYEAFLHGFGQTYNNTYDSTIGGNNSNVTSAVKTDSAQGSIISSPDLSKWGPAAGSFGTLRSITHFSRGATQAIDVVMMIVENTGSYTNAGFTNLVATRSGMTTLTLARSSATYYYSSTNTTRIWLWDDVNYATGTAQPYTYSHDSSLFPGGSGSGSANTTTSSRTTWTVS